MDPQSILATARSGHVPSEWTVWPLRRGKVLRSALEYIAVGLFGTVLLVLFVLSSVPDNFHADTTRLVFTVIVLMLLATLAFGGLGVAAYDFYRVANAERHLIVLTPDDFVMETPRRIVHVPMDQIASVTLKGSSAQQHSAQLGPRESGASVGLSRWYGMAQTRQPKQAPSLAFIDKRTGHEVLVARDDSFEALDALEEILSTYVFNKERKLRRG